MKTEAKIQAIIFFASLFLACTFCLAQPPAQPAQKKNPGASPPVKEEELQGEAQVLKLGTTQIVLNVTVTNAGGRFISGLTSKDFRVFEDKMKQEIVSFTTEETPFAAAILLDTSGSMTPKMSLAGGMRTFCRWHSGRRYRCDLWVRWNESKTHAGFYRSP